MRTIMRAVLVTFGIFLCGPGSASTASAQTGADNWPHRTVRLIVPVGPGTAIDFAARLFAEKLGERWGKSVVVENRPGGDGITGVAAFAGMNDDHALLFAHSAPVAVQPLIHEKLPYDPLRDLVPISVASDIFIVVAVTESLQARSIADLVAQARSQPGALNWAAGPGLPQYVFAAFLKNAGIEMTSVAYREVAPLLQDFGAGRIHTLTHSLAVVRPVVQSGKARLLAIANSQRASTVPDVPTAIETGHPELRMDGLCGLYGWRGIPDPLRERIAADVRAVASDADVGGKLANVGQAARSSTPSEFAATLQTLRERVAATTRAIGVKPGQ
jgi:tripartite-type tricarboxylate transporter receptor subunit TctC